MSVPFTHQSAPELILHSLFYRYMTPSCVSTDYSWEEQINLVCVVVSAEEVKQRIGEL